MRDEVVVAVREQGGWTSSVWTSSVWTGTSRVWGRVCGASRCKCVWSAGCGWAEAGPTCGATTPPRM